MGEALTASKSGMTDAKVNLIAKYEKTIKDSIMMADALKIGHNTKKLAALLQDAQNPAAYSYHSNEVISTLESLLKNFKQKKIESDNDEMATRQEYEMKSGARRNQLKALEKSFSEKSEQVAALTEELNAHETEKQETENSKAADQNFLDDLAKKCEDKAKTFDQRSSTRTAELTAIAKALELLKGDVSKMYPANDLGLVQNKKAASDKQDSDDDAEDASGMSSVSSALWSCFASCLSTGDGMRSTAGPFSECCWRRCSACTAHLRKSADTSTCIDAGTSERAIARQRGTPVRSIGYGTRQLGPQKFGRMSSSLRLCTATIASRTPPGLVWRRRNTLHEKRSAFDAKSDDINYGILPHLVV